MHRWISSALPRAVKLLALVPGRSLISWDILLSNMHVAELEASSVVAESSGEEATADKSEEVGTLVVNCLSSFHVTK